MKRMLTTFELAEYLRVHPDTIKKLVKEGKLPSIQIGRQLRFDSASVVKALSTNTTDTDEDSTSEKVDEKGHIRPTTEGR